VFDRHLRLRTGESLPLTRSQYDAGRPRRGWRQLRSVCFAPYLSMDFDATGAIRLCNHSHTEVGNVARGDSVLDVWRGPVYERYRREFADYTLDRANCPHCVRQCETGAVEHVFARQQFDRWAGTDAQPRYPKLLIFRLNSTCNLACIMCDGNTSSRIRRERDGLPVAPSAYGERFFTEMEEILPHTERLEFYGGEPFLVREHQRIFEILQRVGARCAIYANTNCTALGPRARQALESLNFVDIAVSMDAISGALHSQVRRGIDHARFLENFAYLLDLRARRGVRITLNVTEHRKNWFELPEIFRFAEQHDVYMHINTCIHPHNVTLYTLPDDQLRYVLDHLREQRAALLAERPQMRSLGDYDYLLSLITSELARRGPDWAPVVQNRNLHSDGLLAAPVPGVPPFDDPARVLREQARMRRFLAPEVVARLARELLVACERLAAVDARWQAVVAALRPDAVAIAERLPPVLREAGPQPEDGAVSDS
jgi:MoaA/NifB/PqqE/SkfB family radical SAM enzyme